MSDRKTNVVTLLNESRHRLFEALDKMEHEDWEIVVYSEEADTNWTASDVLRHLVGAERGMTQLMQKILTTGEGVPEDFDRERYNKRQVQKVQDKSPIELMTAMSENRTELLTFIDSLKEEDWDKSGRHGSLKIMTIEEICQTIANHELAHLDDIQIIRKV